MTGATCAFARCQGYVILPGAPVMSELVFSSGWLGFVVDEYHPGCWAAEMRRTDSGARP